MITHEHMIGIEFLVVCIMLVGWLAMAAEDWDRRRREEREAAVAEKARHP